MKYILWITIFCVLSIWIQAQNPCGVDDDIHAYVQKDTNAKKKIQMQEVLLNNYRTNKSSRSNIVIPIVIHIVYQQAKDTISNINIYNQIDQLNKDFSALNDKLYKVPDLFKKDIADIGIQFCLSMVDEDGNKARAVEQKATNQDFFGEQKDEFGQYKIKHSLLGGFKAWDTERFINIWVGEMETISGLASFPGVASFEEDGIVIDYNHFEKANHTLTHEMGHYLNLKHLWGDEEQCESDDLVADTPSQEKPYFDCPDFPQISCNSADMFMNFMNFTNDDCIVFFTEGQKQRMLKSLMLFRKELLNEQACQELSEPFNLSDNLEFIYRGDYIEFEFRTIPLDKIKYAIYDIMGRLIDKGTFGSIYNSSIDIKHLASAIYFVEITYREERKTFKFIKR